MNFKDHFSGHADVYAQNRPQYPDDLYVFLTTLTERRGLVWDVGTGNGQAAVGLARHYEKVWATDASAQQIARAMPNPKVHYAVSPADKVELADRSVDLVTVASALHWFNFETFFPEVNRVLKPGGVFAAWCYTETSSGFEKAIVKELVDKVLSDYWPPENKIAWNQYRDIPFPFEEIPAQTIPLELTFTYRHFTGYIESWSASQRYIKEKGHSPIVEVEPKLKALWGDLEAKKTVIWELLVKAGRKKT